MEAFFQGYKPVFPGSNLGQGIGVSFFFNLIICYLLFFFCFPLC